MKKIAAPVFIVLSSMTVFCFGQNKVLDSLEVEFKTAKHDTIKCWILEQIIVITQDPQREKVADRMYELTRESLAKTHPDKEKKLLLEYQSVALSYKSEIEETKGNPAKAQKFSKIALKICEAENDEMGIANACHNLGASYRNSGDVVTALEYFHRALSILEKLGNKKRISGTLSNLAITYDTQGDSANSMNYYLRSLEIRREIGDKGGQANCFNGIGKLYSLRGHTAKALEYFNKALAIHEGLADPNGIATALNNLGSAYEKQGNNSEALKLYTRALEIFKKENYIRGIVPALINISVLYERTGRHREAERYALEGIELAKKISAPQYVKTSAFSLSKIYKSTGRYEASLKNYELYVQMRDSINNESTRKASIRSQLKYEYEKQAAADSVAHAKENEIKSAELSRQAAEIKAKKNQQYALFGGLALVMVFAGFMYNRFKVTQKQKTLIEQQKEIVEEQKKLVDEKQKEILDSIQYAKRIQLAQIPSEKAVEKNLNRLRSKVKG
jgi:tetratricopeptide (TPR) repeat protein